MSYVYSTDPLSYSAVHIHQKNKADDEMAYNFQETDAITSPGPILDEVEDVSKPGILRFEGADTLVFIDPPSYKPTWSLQPQSGASIPHYIHSRSLLDTDSPYFKKLFKPRNQARMIKRAEFQGKLPNGIKYVIDLTPPSMDDDAVAFTTELSCPMGIRTWARASDRWLLPQICVGKDEGFEAKKGCQDSVLPSEYSDSRHRTGIVHILQALGHLSPCLDTPCKLWTFFALAKVFGIASIGHINIHILTWIYERTNTRFIELHPEIAYRIARGIECDYLCQDSFAVLVGEEALLRLANAGKEPRLQWPEVTFHGRSRDPLDDEDRQRIEYASQSLVDRILEEFIQLTGSQMHWLLQLPSTMDISLHTEDCTEYCPYALKLIGLLKSYVRGHIVTNLTRPGITWAARTSRNIDPHDYPTQKFANAYGGMRYIERVISKTFWRTLRTEKHNDRLASLDSEFQDKTIADLGDHLYPFQAESKAKLSYTSLEEVLLAVNQFNSHVDIDSPNFGYRKAGDVIFMERRGTVTHSPAPFIFNPFDFLQQVRSYLDEFSESMAEGCRHGAHFHLTDTTTCLTDNELKYLPLWAGGNDDGTGGVFTDQGIPNLETGGFSTPGPAIHTGSTVPSTTSYSTIAPSEYQSTVQRASHKATRSHWTDVLSLNSSEGHAMADESHEPTPGEAPTDTGDLFVDLDTSADDLDDCFDTDSEDNDTVIMGTPSQGGPVEEASEMLEHMSLGA
ncbi:hypothetical protein AbraIFM66950_003912 [Aspergillus brasiliensis]|nr:hypothetical protein AbraIFM66950_003912 [Aspergillus brasiliensis]